MHCKGSLSCIKVLLLKLSCIKVFLKCPILQFSADDEVPQKHLLSGKQSFFVDRPLKIDFVP